MTLILGERQRPEPDLSIIKAEALGDGSETWYPAEAAVLVIEVVSPESAGRDRERKPKLYAQAGIQHFWRVERIAGDPVVHVHEFDPSIPGYALTGIHRNRIKLGVPFDIDINLEG